MDYVYRVGGREVRLSQNPELVGVRYAEPAPKSKRAAFAARAGADFSKRLEVPNEKFTVLQREAVSGDAVHKANAVKTEQPSTVARLSPVFDLGAVKVMATDRVLVGLKDHDAPIQTLIAGMKVLDVRSRGFGEYTLRLAEDVDPLHCASELAARAEVKYAEPDFVNIGPRLARAPGQTSMHKSIATLAPDAAADPLLSKQYAAVITSAHKSWGRVKVDPAVTIAVLDEGVDTRHEDLRKAIVGSYDAIDRDEFQEPNPWDGHGTACAGLAAAVPNKKGIRGIAGGCSILAVRIAYSEKPQGKWVTTNESIGQAIDWSWMKGASVLSNSWGGGAPSNAILNAIDRARTNGRKGKGCVVVAAAGNEASAVGFPATTPGVLAVSASNEWDEFKTRDSQDGENWWGSNFGPEIGICAPGVHNYTTDNTGEAGYNANKTGHYYTSFNGTSSATPIVAGAAALVLCVNPDLTELQVRNILCANADQIGADPYPEGRNDRFGHGRLNVLRAVEAAAQASA
jgi:thermitase